MLNKKQLSVLEQAKRNIKGSFYIFTRDGHIKPGIKRAFLQNMLLDGIDLMAEKMILADGSEWIIHAEEDVREATARNHIAVSCIASFQEYKNGDHKVFIRRFKPAKEEKD